LQSEQWRIDFADCFFEKTLGKGVNSIVYYGKWKEQEVALKVLRVENIQRDLEDFKGYVPTAASLPATFSLTPALRHAGSLR
jgi:hypothetical protein